MTTTVPERTYDVVHQNGVWIIGGPGLANMGDDCMFLSRAMSEKVLRLLESVRAYERFRAQHPEPGPMTGAEATVFARCEGEHLEEPERFDEAAQQLMEPNNG